MSLSDTIDLLHAIEANGIRSRHQWYYEEFDRLGRELDELIALGAVVSEGRYTLTDIGRDMLETFEQIAVLVDIGVLIVDDDGRCTINEPGLEAAAKAECGAV